MFKGTVTFMAKIKGNGLKFPLVEFNPKEPGVDKVEIEGPNGDEIHTTVHLASVRSDEEGRALATRVNTAALNRISFYHNIAVENARSTGDQFSPLKPQPGVFIVAPAMYSFASGEASLVIGIPADQLKAELEPPYLPGEEKYGLFRSARQSMAPVEEFMHLYNILLMIFDDSQADVDAFIMNEDLAVPQTPKPPQENKKRRKKKAIMETIYTRLRNEFAHKRVGVNLDNTKSDMAIRLGGLIGLTKRAIEMHP